MDERSRFWWLCSQVGFVTVQWAQIENALDGCVAIAFHECGGNQINKEIPRSLKNKIEFLKQSYSTLPRLLPLKDEALTILSEIGSKSDGRHDLVHSVALSFAKSDGSIDLLKLDYEKTVHRARRITVTDESLSKTKSDSEDLASRILDFGLKTAKHLGLLEQADERLDPQAPRLNRIPKGS